MKRLLNRYRLYKFFLCHCLNSGRAMASFPKVFVKHLDAEEKMKIYFTFGIQQLPERNFTFMRPKDEKLETTISRMKMKIVEAINNKLFKKKKKVAAENTVPLYEITISLTKDGKLVDEDVKNIDAFTENTQMKINEFIYEVLENPPSVLLLTLPKNIMSGFPVYPRIDLEYCTKGQSDFTWYRTLTKSDKSNMNFDSSTIVKIKNENWLLLSNDFFYITNESDIGRKLRISCIPKSEGKVGLVEDAVSNNVVQSGPNGCPFEDRFEFTKEVTGPDRIRCVSYNILADLYADSETARNDFFPYCPVDALMLDYRKQLYLKEIIGYNVDIICLQEVDRKVFHGDLIPVLSSTGLDGIYSEKGGQVIEGLACFFRTSKFRVVQSHGIILSDALRSEPVLHPILLKVSENEKLRERLMNRTTALQVVLLESVDMPQKRILVGNTHLYFHPESDNIRLIQAASCLLYLGSLLQKYQKEDPLYTTSLMFSGDFNSCPENGVYELTIKGFLSENSIDWQSNPEEVVSGTTLTHNLSLDSACGTPAYTNYTEGFVGCLDYIFYDKSQLEVCSIVPFPTHEQVTKHRAIPSKLFPSDHIALICTLGWK